jgi:NADPH2:quinone reductase
MMKAAWYETQGAARDVLVVGEVPEPEPGPAEVRIRVAASGINPGDVKKRQDAFGYGMPYPRVIPHNDGAGTIDQVGHGVPPSRVGERVWCYGAQSYRPFGTAAEYVVVPSGQAVPLPNGVPFEQGACLGIPGITAHRSVHCAGQVAGRTVLIQGGAGSVGMCAVQLARQAGARVLATVRSNEDVVIASRAGAHEVITVGGIPSSEIVARVRKFAPQGVAHIIEVAFDANIELDAAILAQGGSLAAYATGQPSPPVPFWQLVFLNIRVFFLGSDDFPVEAKAAAAYDLNAALEANWSGFEDIRSYALSAIAEAHENVESRKARGRVVVML